MYFVYDDKEHWIFSYLSTKNVKIMLITGDKFVEKGYIRRSMRTSGNSYKNETWTCESDWIYEIN